MLFCVPTALTWIYLLFGRLAPESEVYLTIFLTLVGLSFLTFTGSIAMIFVKPEIREWRIVAIFTAAPFVLLLLYLLVVGPGLA